MSLFPMFIFVLMVHKGALKYHLLVFDAFYLAKISFDAQIVVARL